MGVTIYSKHYSADLGYAGFFLLRSTVASLLGEDIGKHYKTLRSRKIFLDREEEKLYWAEYDRKTEEIANRYPKNRQKVFAFLYTPDTDGSVTYGTCRQLLSLLDGYDDDVCYGYAGRPDCAKMRDFKRLLEDCVENKTALRLR